MSDIFVSYANENRDRIMPLVRALEANGWSVFWDREIPTGKTWRQVIGKEIRDARTILVVWSKQSIESAWVQEEAEDGKQRGILFPVRMDNVVPPFGFGTIQSADLSGWDGLATSAVFRRLVSDLSKTLGKPPAAVVPREIEEEERRRRQEAKRRADEEAQQARRRDRRRGGMALWTSFVVLLAMWLLGLLSSYTMGGFIHFLLLLAVVVLLISLFRGRRVA